MFNFSKQIAKTLAVVAVLTLSIACENEDPEQVQQESSGATSSNVPCTEGVVTKLSSEIDGVTGDSITELDDEEVSDSVAFVVELNKESSCDVIVHFEFDGSATLGTDYLAASLEEKLTIPAGELSAELKLWVFGDDEAESAETIQFKMDEIENAISGFEDNSIVVIVDND